MELHSGLDLVHQQVCRPYSEFYPLSCRGHVPNAVINHELVQIFGGERMTYVLFHETGLTSTTCYFFWEMSCPTK